MASICIYYFNSKIGHWEPAVDSFKVVYSLTDNEKVMMTKVVLADPININFSDSFAALIGDMMEVYD